VTGEAEKRLVAQLLSLMDGIEPRQNLVVIAATNRPEALDEALRRPGRFDREIVVGVPDEHGRREILEIHTRGMPLSPDVDIQDLARRTYGFVGADLAALTREAAMEAVRRIMPRINPEKDTIPTEVLDALSVERATSKMH
jgi:transitional endoplasmic reticulum ATPase